jgi:hypothetical protein
MQEKGVSKIHDVLAELKDLGALGTPEDSRKRTVAEVTVESGAPSVPLRDARGDRTAALLEQLSEQLQAVSEAAQTIAEASAAAAETVAELSAVWADADVPVEVDAEVEDPAPAKPPKKEVAAVVAPVEKPAKQADAKPENYEQIMASVRRRVRGEDLTPADLARAHGEAVPEEDDVPDVVPLGRLDFTPSWPKKE